MRKTLNDNKNIELINNLMKYNWDFPDSNCSEGIHSIHPYPAKFIPEIPRTLIKELKVDQGSFLLDPFCGSGTTLLEAQRAGIPSIGIDLNPIACLISRVKTTVLPATFIRVAFECTENAKMNFIPPKKEIPNVNHWFNKDIQEAISCLLVEIGNIKGKRIKDALSLALSSILVRVSRQESDTRYAAIEKKMRKDDVYNLFIQACKRIADTCTNRNICNNVEANVIEKDILKVTSQDIDKPVGIVITSPPYPNAYEYWLYHKYRMWWLGFNPIKVRQQEIGARAHYFKKNHHTADDFSDNMKSTFNLLSSVMINSSYACFVIGNSRIHGKDIDNVGILRKAAEETNFDFIADICRKISANRKSFNLSHARIKTEYILIFKKR